MSASYLTRDEIENIRQFAYWGKLSYYHGPVLTRFLGDILISNRKFFENYSGGLYENLVCNIVRILRAFEQADFTFVEMASEILYVLGSLKNYYAYTEFLNGGDSDVSDFREEIKREYWDFVFIFHKDPNYLRKLMDKYEITYEDLELFMNNCKDYSNKNLQDNNMKQLVEFFLKRKNFKPFFVFYYDQEVSTVKPWITQVIFVHQNSHLIVRISYNDFKFGFYKKDPFNTENGTLRFIRNRWNEAGKYCEGFLIPSKRDYGWSKPELADQLLSKCHYRIQPMEQEAEDYPLPNKINNQIGIFDPVKAEEIKKLNKNNEDCDSDGSNYSN